MIFISNFLPVYNRQIQSGFEPFSANGEEEISAQHGADQCDGNERQGEFQGAGNFVAAGCKRDAAGRRAGGECDCNVGADGNDQDDTTGVPAGSDAGACSNGDQNVRRTPFLL